MNDNHEESTPSLLLLHHQHHHFRSTSVPTLTTSPPPLEDIEIEAGAETTERGGSRWSTGGKGNNDLWFGSEGRLGQKRPSLRVLVHSAPLPSHPTFPSSSSPHHLHPPTLILTPASPPPDPVHPRNNNNSNNNNIPHSLSSPSLPTLSFFNNNNCNYKRSSTLPSLSSKLYDQQALLTPAPYSPTSPSARRFTTTNSRSCKKDSIDLTLLPLYEERQRVYRGRGEKALERLSRLMAWLMLLLAGVIVLRVLGDVWVAKRQTDSWSGGEVVVVGNGSRGGMVMRFW